MGDIREDLPIPGSRLLTSFSPSINTRFSTVGMRHFGKQKQVFWRKSVPQMGVKVIVEEERGVKP